MPTDREREYWRRVGEAKREHPQIDRDERLRAGLDTMRFINDLRRSRGLPPFEPLEPPEELGFHERARRLGHLG